MRPFGCPVTILNTIDHLGKFDGKADEDFFIGYSLKCEVFNGKLVGGRDYTLLPLWSLLGNILSKRIVNVNKVIDRCDGPLTPTATKILKANLDEVKKYTVDWGGDEFYQVNTWKKVYSFKIKPIRGRIHWPKCNVPTTLLPPEHQPQVDIPPKQRKKSTTEIDVLKIVKNGKLSRKHKTVTCDKYKTKGHNSRSCTCTRVL
ncbi:hypothetical protein Tco_0677476 [Tanacetum coccineum]|uniref:DUF4283 domain-containing protein n=1 Tax=Tanacetum coccineum TaxID=301880 RepID=A0ABQ4XCA3_9ASTR